MASSYAAVTFDIMMDDVFGPEWTRESNVSVRHIPYANIDDVQFGKLGNERLRVRARVSTLANLNTLKNARDGTARTFGFEGTNFANTYLIDVTNERRMGGSSAVLYEFEAEFMRIST